MEDKTEMGGAGPALPMGTQTPAPQMSTNDLASALASALAGQTVAGVSARRFPSFGRAFPNIWFAQVEHIFRMARVTSERTMYSELIATMEPSVLATVADVFLLPETEQTYTNLKKMLQKQYSESESERLQRLLQDIVLDDKKPSDLLREMRNLAQGKLDENIMKHLWEQRLPHTVRMILTSNKGSIADVAEQADQLMAIAPNQNISVVATPEVAAVSREAAASATAIAELTKMVKNLSHQVAALKAESRSRSRERAGKPGRENSKSSAIPRADETMCYYHRKWKAEATKCKPPCTYPNSGN